MVCEDGYHGRARRPQVTPLELDVLEEARGPVRCAIREQRWQRRGLIVMLHARKQYLNRKLDASRRMRPFVCDAFGFDVLGERAHPGFEANRRDIAWANEHHGVVTKVVNTNSDDVFRRIVMYL